MRPLPLMLLSCLMLGCSSKPVEPPPGLAVTATSNSAVSPATSLATQDIFQLSGSLLTPSAGSVVELAVLLIDPHGRPQGLLGSNTLIGTGQPLPFTIGFAKHASAADQRLQLRARVSLSGHLVQRLPGKAILPQQDTNLGALQLVSAP